MHGATNSPPAGPDLHVVEANRRLDFARGLRTPRVSVVIPALNEAENLPWVLSRLPVDVHEVVLVDGDSTDDTVAVARAGHASIRIVRQHARGKGAALAAGLLAARGDIIVMIDADGSMDPAEIPALVGALISGADVAKGSRYVVGGGSADLTRLRGFGNRALTYFGRLLYRQRWSELCYGFAAFWSDAIPMLGLEEIAGGPTRELTPEDELAEIIAADAAVAGGAAMRKPPLGYGHGFEIEAILFTRSTRAGLRVTEVASWEYERQYGASKLNTFRDGWRVLGALLRERRRSPLADVGRGLSPEVDLVALELDAIVAESVIAS
jgi:glycosyltransferase involved in cell wall biosynthesis